MACILTAICHSRLAPEYVHPHRGVISTILTLYYTEIYASRSVLVVSGSLELPMPLAHLSMQRLLSYRPGASISSDTFFSVIYCPSPPQTRGLF